MNEQKLIHMNGRVYDYNLGRFMSVDPLIQSPTSTQSVNPYSYIMNNPLAGTDPTGYCTAATGTRIKSCGDLKVDVKVDGKTVGSAVVKDVNFKNGADVSSAMSAGTGKIASAISDIGSPQQNAQKNVDNNDNLTSELATGMAFGSAVLGGVESLTNGKTLVPPMGDFESSGQSRGLGKLEDTKVGKINQISLKNVTQFASRAGGLLGVAAVVVSAKANREAFEKGYITAAEYEGEIAADTAIALISMRGGAVAGAAYFIADYVFSKDDVNGIIMIKRSNVKAFENTRSTLQELGSDMKGIRREYDSTPASFLHKMLGVQEVSH
ncbi:hypothetical protein HWQ48_24530 [Shewanella sp. E94]|nr:MULTISPECIES: RHS repeat-associated core domain-containing protein [unclassified Shewanella]MEC4740472.1 hypothetical protein [Shewanella sp. E94]WBJ98301.1 hypothetical protein HWQ47_25575 [Shewanella sp. MTB7]